MKRRQVLDTYLSCLGEGDTNGLIALFARDGIVLSPLYGRKTAPAFYRDLASQTQQSQLALRGIYLHEEDAYAAALAFHYRWTLRDGRQVSFECVDLVRFDKTYKIAELTIVYDTHPLRAQIIGLGDGSI